ncbi:hypothetical protein B0T22DRAFT_353952, partial [Podospora appendiculata]
MRKSRASHIKCDCGEKTHKCMHLKTTVDGHKDSCCCNHGGRCTCCHKKDLPQLDTNGHHKPTYKHAKPSQKCGPYQLTRVNSLHSTSNM